MRLSDILTTSPVTFINTITLGEARFVVFCATWLGILTLAWAVIYLLFRPIPKHNIFAPFEHLSRRVFNIGVLTFSVIISYVASVALKNYERIGRPDILNVNLRPLIRLSDYGFPSSHAAFYSALAVSLFLINRRAGVFAGLLGLVIGAARILAGVHTPLDILGGFVLGTFISFAIHFMVRKVA